MEDLVKLSGPESVPQPEPPRPRLRIGSRLLADAHGANGLLLRAGGQIANASQLYRLTRPDVRFGEGRLTEAPIDEENEAALDAAIAESELDTADVKKRIARAVELKIDAVSDVASVFARIEAEGEVNVDLARDTVAALLQDLLDDPRALVSLVQLKDVDAYTYTHSVNVCVLTLFLAVHSKLKADAEEIGLGALLHDVGKARVPPAITNKDGPLNELEQGIMKQHPAFGARILEDSGITDGIPMSCVRDHHEKVSGGGYPSGKRAELITPHALLTCVADIYDALTTDRSYRKALNPRDALLLMTQKMRHELDPGVLKNFVSHVGYFPVGSDVLLSNGYVAKVVRHHASDPLRPAVELITDPMGRDVSGERAVDLRKEKGVYVKEFVRERSALDVARDAAA